MADATLVFRVPIELQDIVINVVEQILRVREENYTDNNNGGKLSRNINTNASYAANTHKEEEKEIYKEKDEESPKGFRPPSYEEVFSYMRDRNSPVNPGRFYNWMKDHNWVDGRGEPITDWKKKVEDWEKKALEVAPKQTKVQKMNAQLQTSDRPKVKNDTAKLYKRLIETGDVTLKEET